MYKLFIDGKLVTRNGKAQLSPILERKGLTLAQIDELFDDGEVYGSDDTYFVIKSA